jgi:hypothetical protein
MNSMESQLGDGEISNGQKLFGLKNRAGTAFYVNGRRPTLDFAGLEFSNVQEIASAF